MALKVTIFNTEEQKVKIYQQDMTTLVLEIVEVSDQSSIRLYMDKELVAQIANQLSDELRNLK
jgi:hypothetical protein